MVRVHPLTRLRLAFLALALVLLAPLSWLLWTAHARLAQQRHLRHQVVAERIFDELERELTSVLVAESERSSDDYDRFTTMSAWAPFIVGYFTLQGPEPRFSAAEQLPRERLARLSWALLELQRSHPAAKEVVPPPPASPLPEPKHKDLAPAPRPVSSGSSSVRTGSGVLRQLNRGSEARQRSSPSSQHKRDPMIDYGY